MQLLSLEGLNYFLHATTNKQKPTFAVWHAKSLILNRAAARIICLAVGSNWPLRDVQQATTHQLHVSQPWIRTKVLFLK